MTKETRNLELLDGLCHSERSRGISKYLTLPIVRDVSTTLDMTTTAVGRPGSETELALRNDEARMTNDEGSRNARMMNISFVLCHSTPVRLGPFVIF